MKKKIICIGIISMFLLTSITTLSAAGIKTELKDRIIGGADDVCITLNDGYEEHPPIRIYKNEDFTEANGVREGSGTLQDPYKIYMWNVEYIEIYHTDAYFEISDCNIGLYGVHFLNLANGVISHCTVTTGEWSPNEGIILTDVYDCVISYCTLDGYYYDDVHSYGIYLDDGDPRNERPASHNNIIHNCIITNYCRGIELAVTRLGRKDNVIRDCTISNCKIGIYVQMMCGDNLIYHNNIFDNLKNHHIDDDFPLLTGNSWNLNNEGNYWDDYTGEDKYDDGIGDTPYILNDLNKDRYPLMKARGKEDNKPPATPEISGSTNGKIRQEYTYTTITTDPEADKVRYCFNWGDGTKTWTDYDEPGETVNVIHTWTKQGNYEIKVKARDIYGYESTWSDPLPVNMPRNQAINTPLFNFLQQHPMIFQLLQRFIKL